MMRLAQPFEKFREANPVVARAGPARRRGRR
jgi:hypothetical protein